MPRHWIAFIAFACFALACDNTGAPKEDVSSTIGDTEPYTIVNPKIVERTFIADLELRSPSYEPRPEDPVKLLVCFHNTPNFDPRVLGKVLRTAMSMPDEYLDGEVVFGTLVSGDPDDYLGAWWASDTESNEWLGNDTVRMDLHRWDRSGVMVGDGYITAAIVRGRFGQGTFEFLSKPVTFPHQGETPPPPNAPSELSGE